MRAVARLLACGRTHTRRLLLAVLLTALTYLCGVGLMGISAWLISRAAEHPNASALTLAAVAVRALGLGRGLARYAERLVGHDATLEVVADLRVAVYQSLVRTPPGRLRAGDVLSRVVSDVEAVQDLYLRCLIPAVGAVVVATVSVVACWLWLPAAGMVLLAGLVTAIVVVPTLAGTAARHESVLAGQRAEYQVRVLDVVHGCADLAVSGELPSALAAAADATAALADGVRRTALRGALVSAVTALLQGGTVLAVLAVTLPAVQDGTLPRVGLAVVVLIALAAFEPIPPLADAGALLPRSVSAARRLAQLLDGEAQAADLRPAAGAIRLRGVTVRYPAAARPALDGIDLDLVPGVAIAVVGESGAGKSTLLRVLTGQVVPDAGTAEIGGHPLGASAVDELARQVVLAEQEGHLFDTSIRDNLLLARPDATQAELELAAADAGLLTWIRGLPAGWETPVGERGSRMSGGERKRLSVARALLSRAPVLLLDEPTEGLDPNAADALVRRLLAVSGDRAVVLVTHRLVALDQLDEVIVLDSGRVVQRGVPANLAVRPGLFRALLDRQLPEAVLTSIVTG